MPIDWGKYGINDDGQKKKTDNVTSVDWSRYEPRKTEFLTTDQINERAPGLNMMGPADIMAKDAPLTKYMDSLREQDAKRPENQNAVTKFLHKVFQDNPVMRVINAPFQHAAEKAASLPYLGGKADDKGYHSLGERMRAENVAPSTGNATLDKVAETAGGFIAPFYGMQGAPINVATSNPVQQLASRLGSKAGSGLAGRTARSATALGIEGAYQGFGGGLATDPTPTVGELAMSTAVGGALGGGLGVGGEALSAGVKAAGGQRLADALRGIMRKPEPKPQDVLMLPPSRTEDIANRANGTVLPPNTDPIYAPGDVHTFGLPEPNVAAPTRARVETRPNEYRQKFEQLAAAAREQNLPPGREYQAVDDLWSRMAGPQDPSLDELINLAYPPSKPKLTPDSVQKAREFQRKMQTYGVNGPVKSMGERYTPFVGNAAMPETIVKGVPKQPAVDIIPPKRNFPPEEPKTPADTVNTDIPSFDPTTMNDISGFEMHTKDVYRNFEKVLGKDNAKMYLEPFDTAKKANVDMQEYWTKRLKTEVVDKLGIQKGSKLSGMVQKFGEKQISLDELKQQAPNDWQKVVEADRWFRESYNHMIDIVNEARAKVYPNNPDKIVPKREDYYRHFREMEGLSGLKNLFDSPSAIDPKLAGISEFTKPQSKFAGFMQKRGLGPYKNDAVGGFLNYIPSASYATHIDPEIGVFRDLMKSLGENTTETRNMNNFIKYLDHFANDLAGKTNPADRFIQEMIPGGRKTMAAINWLNNRVKANTILGNASSTLSQLANIPSGIAFAKQHAARGAGETLAAAFGKNTTPMKESGFLKERYSGEMYRQFDTKWIQQPKNFAGWLMETADRIGTYTVWNSAYAKGVAEKVAEPIKYADDATRKLVAGRGVGEVPLLQKSKVMQVIAPFQLEVANLWRVMGDFVKRKDFGAIATLFVGNYLFNRVMEQVKGSGVTFDPIQATIEAMQPDLTPGQRVGRAVGEVFSNLPLGQTLASVYPEYGGDALGVNLPTRKKLFGDNDPTRFGSGIIAVKGAQDPLYKLAPPFGGNQVKKTLQGIDALRKGGSYKNGKLNYPIETAGPNIARSLLFGPTSTPEAQDYFKNERRPLSEKQTAEYQQSTDKGKFYQDLLSKRKEDTLKSKMKDISKDEELSADKKKKEIDKLNEKLKALRPGG